MDQKVNQNVERVARIELAIQLWQSRRLPLHHTRITWSAWQDSNLLP